MKRLCAHLLLTAFVCSAALAQASNNVTKQGWLDYNPSFFIISPSLQAYGDVGVRKEMGEFNWWRIVVRPGVKYSMGAGFFLTGGVGSFLTINNVIADRWEIRPFQGVSTQWPRGDLSLDHYLRLEERFDFNTVDWSSHISLRSRYKLALSFKWGQDQDGMYWKALVEVEGFIMLAGNQGQFEEQFRLSAGMERSFEWGFRTRAEVTWQKEDTFLFGDESVDAVYFRLRFFQKW